ncbi:hypothetical protein AGMMS49928_06460 [Spirochaetia bacterium]|nr:hypothetical protein AGMMS49928_06460 [Spirochaetia bacterium]
MEGVDALLDTEYGKFTSIWDRLREAYVCPVIQNNFEYPFWRLMGNRDASDIQAHLPAGVPGTTSRWRGN